MPSLDQSKFTPEISDKYTLKNNALVQVAKANPKDKIDVEVGDTKQADFLPQVKIMRWDNEVNFSVRLTDTETGQDKIRTATDKIIYEKGNKKVEFYDYVDGEGGYKLVWYLLKKPKTNKIEFTIQSKGLNFFYQPPLTQEYQNGYSEEFQKEIVVTETQIKDLEGNVLVERPIEVVGSYAVYHQTKGGMVDVRGKDYKTGQAFFIYAPHLFDSNGQEAWGKLHIENGIYSVEIPQEFLDKAVYPIKSNDTFGYTTVGGSTASGASATIYAPNVNTSISFNGNVSSVSIYGKRGASSNVNIQGGVYKTDGTLLTPVSSSLLVDSTTAQWWTVSWSGPSITTDYNYWASVFSAVATGETIIRYYNSGSSGQAKYKYSLTYPNWPNPITFDDSSYLTSIYATYTAEGGGGTNMQLNIGDTWKVVASAKINIGDTWKDVTAAKVNIGDSWKTIF